MRKLLGFLATALLMVSCSSPLLNTLASGPADVAGLKVVPVVSDPELKAIDSVNYGYVIVKVTPEFDTQRFARLGANIDSSMTINGQRYYRLSKDANVSKLINSLRNLNGVLYAEPELISAQVLPITKPGANGRSLSDGNLVGDPSSKYADYALALTGALDSYKTVANGGNDYGANSVYVAVIDTGLNWTHKDFWIDDTHSIVEYAKSAFNKAADGTMTYVNDGQPFVTIPEGENWDDQAHGTHVTGTIAARGENNIGVAGVAWKNTKVISYKCFANATSGSGANWSIYGALGDLANWVKTQRLADPNFQATLPVNMSLGGDFAGNFEYEMINYALSQGVLPIVAMGNNGKYEGQFPASYQGVVAVGATNGKDEKVHFSNSGHWISIAAPGYDILSTGNGSNYWNNPDPYRETQTQWMSGTSMAAPFITGTIGYLLSFNPALTPYQVKAVLEATADDKGVAGFDADYGYGRVNVQKAATMVRTGTDLPADGVLYLNTKIVATVENTSANYDSGLGGVLKQRLIGQTVSLYNAAGEFQALGMTNATDGTVEFRGLKAGDYTVKTNLFGEAKQTPVTLDASTDQTANLSFDKNIIYICTVPNFAYNNGEDEVDTKITVYSDEALTTVVAGPYDFDYLDTLIVDLISGNTYYAVIESWDGDYSAGSFNYAIQIGFTPINSANVTDGARTATAADSHEEDDDGAAATAKGALSLDTPFAATLLNKDVFMFIAP